MLKCAESKNEAIKKNEHMKSIKRNMRSLENYGRRTKGRPTRSRCP